MIKQTFPSKECLLFTCFLKVAKITYLKTVMTAKKERRFLCIVRNFLALVDIMNKLWYINSMSC